MQPNILDKIQINLKAIKTSKNTLILTSNIILLLRFLRESGAPLLGFR